MNTRKVAPAKTKGKSAVMEEYQHYIALRGIIHPERLASLQQKEPPGPGERTG